MHGYCAGMSDSLRLDAASVRVLAHPLRSRLLSALRRGGPATATALAPELETNTGATSYHLRKLASVGLVVDTEQGEGKRRVWRAATSSHSREASDFAGDEDATTALNWLMRDYLAQLVTRYQQWLDVEDTGPRSGGTHRVSMMTCWSSPPSSCVLCGRRSGR
ncbi:ArsR/SmtB family transcription factor [Nocardioides sp. B-3]|uniref:ArsR/SmtB family transcription factor n=1 Tax=Nocardioides sp. B-3 TaxID=2895565 RepID=UPI003FA5A563